MIDKLTKVPSNWQPEQNKKRLAVLGKLLEELGELSSAASRCIIQGVGELEPVSRKPNKEWLEEELADVQAMLMLTKTMFGLDIAKISDRVVEKLEHKKAWLRLLDNEPTLQ